MTTSSAVRRGARPFGLFERRVAKRYLGATRRGAGVSLITIIAFAGIMLSVATLIVVMSVFQGFRVTLLDQLLSVNGHAFVSAGPEPFTDYQARAERLREVEGVTRVTPVLRIEAYAVGNTGQNAALIQGIAKDDLIAIEEVSGREHLLVGGFETFGEGRNGGNEIAIASGLANRLGVTLGDAVTLVTAGGAETAFGRSPTTQKAYQVAAIFRIGNSALDQYFIYMPLEQAQLFARKPDAVSEIEVRVAAPLKMDTYLPPLRMAAGSGALLLDWRDRNSDIFNALEVERGLQRIIMLMIVAVATMLIISGLVMLVKDKRADIAVLRTMGAAQGAILRIFLMVGASIGVTGAASGVILGALIANNLGPIESFLSAVFGFRLFNPAIYLLDEIPSVFEWQEVAIVVVFTLTMSFIFSAYPAWRASKVDPVEALRYE